MIELGFDARALQESSAGGVSVVAKQWFSALQQDGRFSLLPFTTGFVHPRFAQQSKHLRLPNRLLPFFLRADVPKFDAWLGVSHLFLPNWHTIALSPQTDLTLVVHDLAWVRNPDWFSPKQRLWHRLIDPKKITERANHLFAVSEWTKNDLCTLWNIPVERVEVIRPSIAPCTTPRLVQQTDPYILFLGTIEKRKNPMLLLAAFSLIAQKYPQMRVVFAGKLGYGSKEFLHAVAVHSFSARVTVLGHVSAAVKAQLFASATLFVYPSFYEGCGIPVVEAMAAGVPTIVSHTPALLETVGDAALAIAPRSAPMLATAIDAFLSDPSFAEKYAQKGRERAHFFSQTIAEQLARSRWGK